jgi:hypothetical protein
MTFRTWQVEKIKYCEHVGHDIALEVEVIYPAEHLPDPKPLVVAHRCSDATACNMFDRQVCKWCGTNPDHDPM